MHISSRMVGIFGFLMTAIALPAEPGSATATDAALCSDVTAIEEYCKNLVEQKSSAIRPRRFVKLQSGWQEVKGDEEGDAAATVFIHRNGSLYAVFTFTTESGDWMLEATYCFRPDGSLAKRHDHLNTFYGDATVLRDAFFGCDGKLLNQKQHHLDLHTKREKKPAPEFIDEKSPAFMRTRDLPFLRVLR